MNNSGKDCFIKLKKYDEDPVGAYDNVVSMIESHKSLFIDESNGCLGFMTKPTAGELIGEAIPFLFKYFQDEKKFKDMITGEWYGISDVNSENSFPYTKGVFAEYIECLDASTNDESIKEIYQNVINGNVHEYRIQIEELKRVINKGYEQACKDPKRVRIKERNR